MLNRKMDKKISGMTLIETLVVFSVGLVVIALALTVYRSVSNKMNVKNETENLSIMFTQTMDLFSEETTKDLTTALAIEAGIIPDKMKIVGSTVRNTWGGAVTIDGGGGADGAEGDILVVYDRVPTGNTCIDLVRNQRKVGWTNYDIGGDTGAAVQYSAMKTAELTTSCKGAAGKDTIQLSFKYKSTEG